ncbi:MAG: hypothetical protein C0418_06475, partial [Coriobacteriaceae bacterium]|nr:hypothetical protein [Coriobacteriaceae bacterium]
RAHLAILPGARTHCAIPITHEGRVLGFVGIASLEAGRVTDDSKRLLYALASQAGLAVDQIRLNEQAKVMAITDGLTGLYNHRYFHERLAAEYERARRFGHPLSLIMIDVDHFKLFNDRHGHLAGDALLEGLGALLRDNVRRIDMAARYGGEEFSVMLVETGRDEAMAFAERLRAAVEVGHLAQSVSADARITISIGVAGSPSGTDSSEGLIATADRALYRAKAEGRNRVCTAEPEPGNRQRAT